MVTIHAQLRNARFLRVLLNRKSPALHIFPGDTVRTRTFEGSSRDIQQYVAADNPETGPFYIEGALGDTLAVNLNASE
jgi:hypothetical protein